MSLNFIMNILKMNLNLCRYFLLSTFFLLNPSKMAYIDAPHSWQVGFQDPATPIMEGKIDFASATWHSPGNLRIYSLSSRSDL